MRNRVSIRVRVSFRVSSASPFRKIPVTDFRHSALYPGHKSHILLLTLTILVSSS